MFYKNLNTYQNKIYHFIYIMVHSDNMFKIPPSLDEDTICDRIETNITDTDIRRYFGDGVEGKVMKYSDLANYGTID